MKCIVAILLFCYAVSAQDTRPKRCPGGYSEGTQVDLGRYWYECRDGQLVPKGCLNDEGRRIDIMATYDTSNKNYRLQCVVDSSGFLAFTYKSCLYDGIEHGPNEEWEDGKYYYRCDREGDYLRVNIAGCMDQGKRVQLNERVTKGDFIYTCRKSVNGTCSMCPVACTKNGREYSIGESFDIDNLWYTCTNSEGPGKGPIAIKCIGCLNDQKQRLKDGDRFFKDDVVYECAVRDQEAGVRPVGCVQRNENGVTVERRLGCYWVEGNEPYQYEMTCKFDKEANTAVRIQNRCNYKVQQGSYTIEAGCYQIADKTAIACKKEGTSLNIRVYQIDQIGDLTGQGLRFC